MRFFIVLVLLASFRMDVVYAGVPEWNFQHYNGIVCHDSKSHSYTIVINHETQQEAWWNSRTPSDVLKMAREGTPISEKKRVVLTFTGDFVKPENLAFGCICGTKRRVALIAPHISAGTSLGIMKSPEAIQALAGQLRYLGYNPRMFHAAANEDLFTALREFAPDVVGISTMTADYLEGRRIAESLKREHPQLPIILGGWHASGCVQAHLLGQEKVTLSELLNEHSPFDFVVAGEGEDALPALLDSLEQGSLVHEIKGVSFFRNGEIYVNKLAEGIRDLERLAPPSWDNLDVDQYRDKRTGNLDLSVHFNRGCRFQCGFCATPAVYGQGIRTVPAVQAVEYIEYVLDRFHPQIITFTDEDFFAKIHWVEELVALCEQKDFAGRYNVSFDTFATLNDIYRLKSKGRGELLDRMRKAGFASFTVGIESFNPDVLIRYNKELMILPMMSPTEREVYRQNDERKKTTLIAVYQDRVQQVINFAMEHDIIVIGDYMIGNLGESEAEVRAGFDIFKNIDNLLVAYIPVFTPFPGTLVWKEAFHSGLLAKTADGAIDWERFNASVGALHLDYDIEGLRNDLEVSFYTSDRYRRDMMSALVKNPGLKGFFLGRFNYLNETFPNHSAVQGVLNRLLG